MYIKKIDIENIKSFKKFTWELASDADAPGWHVFLGDNGSGKSTLLRSSALALINPMEAMVLREDWASWVRGAEDSGQIILNLIQDISWDTCASIIEPTVSYLKTGAKISKNKGFFATNVENFFDNTAQSFGNGWFSASYGPFRRLTGGNKENEKLFISYPKLAPHLSIFGEDVALTEVQTWLQQLRFEQLESGDGGVLENVSNFINQENFLPNNTRLVEVSSKEVIFRDGGGNKISLNNLSDGYRSLLSMTIELVRQMNLGYKGKDIFDHQGETIICPGVVFIDEIDVHLHPKWQRTIGPWLTEHFPNIQFMVSTHSPLVCQGAERGSIWQLPGPGETGGGRVSGTARDRLLYGNILEALSSGAFGELVERSDKGKRMLEELARLNKLAFKSGLTDEQKRRKEELSKIFGANSDLLG